MILHKVPTTLMGNLTVVVRYVWKKIGNRIYLHGFCFSYIQNIEDKVQSLNIVESF